MPLSTRTLNRTLWARQQLVPDLSLGITDPVGMTSHLIGLQAQENLPPYLSLAARMPGFDPASLSAAIAERRVVRILTMRGTVHVLTPDDALALRPWLQGMLDASAKSNAGSRDARQLGSADLIAAVGTALADGPLPLADLGERLAGAYPGIGAPALRAAARARVPLVQVPPRGLWKHRGGVVYELLTTWLGRPEILLDLPELVRRYLRAFGPASAADLTKWSTVTGLGPVFTAMSDELAQYRTEAGKVVWDVPDGVLADAEIELPPVLLGNYDNIWLSHADRTRITTDDNRRKWMGSNGGLGAALFVDGMLEGIWRRNGDAIEVTPFRRFTRAEKDGVDAEVERIRALLAR